MGSKITIKYVFIIIVVLYLQTPKQVQSKGLKMIPEYIKITYANEKYFDGFHANIRKYARNGDYYMNVWGKLRRTWGNNVTVHVIVTEYLHNEYRRSFIEFHYKFCDMINYEPMFGHMLAKKGIVCPLPKGEYHVMNMTILSQNFPNQWPFEKGGGNCTVTSTDSGEIIATSYVHVLFKQNNKKN